MRVFVVVKCFSHNPESACLGVFRRKKDAVELIENDEDWDDAMRDKDEDLWGNDECSVHIEEHELE
jgi:hypothetical protein